MNRTLYRAAAPAALLLLALTACGSDNAVGNDTTDAGETQDTTDASGTDGEDADGELTGEINGAGASSQEAAMQAWIAGFQTANPSVSVSYDPIGSGGGRTQFVEGGTDFGGTDAILDEDELALGAERCLGTDVTELPLYISPIAVIYNLPELEELNLSPATLAGIFNQEITTWDAPEIAADNPDATLPSTAITPVNRSDESGTTENFVEYLSATAPEAWPHEVSGDWPVAGSQSAQGTSGVVQTVTGGEGTIGYADASQAGSLGTAKILVGEEYVGYSPEAAAAVVDASPRAEGRGEQSLAIELDRTTTADGAYPIVLVSYAMACLQYEDENDATLVREFLSYIASEEGQQASADAAGSAPISESLREQVMEVLDSISAAS